MPARLLSRDALERHQVWWYLAAVALGLGLGSLWPGIGETAGSLIWPALAALLYATFTQVHLDQIPAALRDRRFVATALVGNFVLIPVIVLGLVQFAPADAAVRLGLFLVLLVPCTDWFITFTHLGGGDAGRATAITPIMLLVQLAVLPVYLWLLAGVDVGAVFGFADLWPALLVVLGPLALAWVTGRWVSGHWGSGHWGSGRWASGRAGGEALIDRLGWWPVPLLAGVILLVAASHVGDVLEAAHLLPVVAAIAAAYLVAALALATVLAGVASLPLRQGRTLAFSLGTRNSFIVLPFALALPVGWEAAAIVVVTQSLVELVGMAVAIRFVPAVLMRD